MRGAGQRPDLLSALTPADLEFLPGCVLEVASQTVEGLPGFSAIAPSGSCCQFSYQGKTAQVSLGFSVAEGIFQSYDKGIDPDTGQATWGALLGPYRFQKRSSYDLKLSA